VSQVARRQRDLELLCSLSPSSDSSAPREVVLHRQTTRRQAKEAVWREYRWDIWWKNVYLFSRTLLSWMVTCQPFYTGASLIAVASIRISRIPLPSPPPPPLSPIPSFDGAAPIGKGRVGARLRSVSLSTSRQAHHASDGRYGSGVPAPADAVPSTEPGSYSGRCLRAVPASSPEAFLWDVGRKMTFWFVSFSSLALIPSALHWPPAWYLAFWLHDRWHRDAQKRLHGNGGKRARRHPPVEA